MCWCAMMWPEGSHTVTLIRADNSFAFVTAAEVARFASSSVTIMAYHASVNQRRPQRRVPGPNGSASSLSLALTSQYPPARVRNRDANDFDGATAIYHDIPVRPDEAVAYKVEQFGCEPANEEKVCSAALSCIGEHFERPAPAIAHGEAHDKESGMQYAIRAAP
jgi:hypothetical protein